MNKKLVEKWKAERAYFTESKRLDTHDVIEAGKDLDIKEYKVILSPNACEKCSSMSNGGHKIFKNSDLHKGEGTIPPFHPNCYCVLIPK